ncbi:aldo/keto reductase [Devosia psychrophila]|uniref:aldo/keto reductase n=1 Tax=Devosia psychrophila TaxID=728005 RepID=UPI0031F55981
MFSHSVFPARPRFCDRRRQAGCRIRRHRHAPCRSTLAARQFRKESRLRELGALAQSRGIKVSQLALAWLLAQGEAIVPIPGTRRIERVEENVAALDIALSTEELARIRDILPDGAFGARYAGDMIPNWI